MERAARRRAGLTLAGISIAVVTVLIAVSAVVIAHYATSPHPAATPPVPTTTPTRPAGNGTAAQEVALALRPMLQLPAEAAQPQALTNQTAGPPITLPTPTQTAGRWIPGGFPDSATGALGQLRALDETAMTGGDPQVYATGYRQLSAPGAPDPVSTGLYAVLTSMRARAGLAATGAISGLTVTYQVDAAQIKGITTTATFAVVCVLGQLSVSYQGQILTAGVGDCQAMTWTGATWLIAPGALAFPAPCAWPGSADAIHAGYRAVS